MNLLNFENSKKQGDAGLGVAISYFVLKGYTVFIPLTDSQDSDLVVDMDGVLKRIQVKTTKFKRNGMYILNLRVFGGNRSGKGKVKLFNQTNNDYVFAFTNEGDRYLIPTEDLKGIVNSILLGNKYSKYKV